MLCLSFTNIFVLSFILEPQQNMKYPIGIQSFDQIREDGYVYVDKTGLIYNLEVNHAAGKYLSNHTDIIIKLIFCNCSDSDTALVNGHGGTGITKNKIKNEYQYE